MPKSRKKENIAIPFLITVLISLIIVGGVAIWILDYIDKQSNDKHNLKAESTVTDNTEKLTPSAEDNMTILFMLDMQDNGVSPDTFVVVRTLPQSKKIIVVPVRSDTVATLNGKTDTLQRIYADDGMLSSINAIEKIFDIQIDRYIMANDESFCKMCDFMGNAKYEMPEEFASNQQSGDLFIGSKQIQSLIISRNYDEGEAERMLQTGSVLVAMLNQTNGELTSNLLDDEFIKLSADLDTDISVVDYEKHKDAAKYLLLNGNNPAELQNPVGTSNEDDEFVISPKFVKELKGIFELDSKTEDKSSSSQGKLAS